MLGRSIVFQTLIYGAQANVISSNETLLCAYMKCHFNFGDSKWDIKFPNKHFIYYDKYSHVQLDKFSLIQYLIINWGKHHLEEASHTTLCLYREPDLKLHPIDSFRQNLLYKPRSFKVLELLLM